MWKNRRNGGSELEIHGWLGSLRIPGDVFMGKPSRIFQPRWIFTGGHVGMFSNVWVEDAIPIVEYS